MENEENKEEKPEYHKLIIDGDEYQTLLTKKYLARKPFIRHNPGKVVSFIPGSVNKVFVKEGQNIKVGEKLMILEAMKMENIVFSPIKGKIIKIHVSTGERVANKQPLVDIK